VNPRATGPGTAGQCGLHAEALAGRLCQLGPVSLRQTAAKPASYRYLDHELDVDRDGGSTMANSSSIEWTEATWNPTTGCDRISEGCDNCYALTLAKRLKAMGQAKYQVDGDPRTSGPGFGLTLHEDALTIPLRWRAPRTVFVNSMSDLFHARVPVEFIRRVFEVMEACPQHTFQVLTKRARRVRILSDKLPWPSNVWMGVSVENNTHLKRVDELRTVPAAVRFLSCEPLLGSLDLLDLRGIHWVIAGGESGPNCRPVDIRWVSEIKENCQAAGVPFFFKQWGGKTPKAGGRHLEGRTWDEMPSRATG
jgi:protein gp37